MKLYWKSILGSFILGCLLIIPVTSATQAQDEDLTVGLTLPNEGETFYAGPSSLLYMIPIRGWVKSVSFMPVQVSVEIGIYQNSTLVSSLTVTPDIDGKYETFAQVNPGAYSQIFAAEFITCGDVCHFNPLTQFQQNEWVPDFELPPGPMTLVVTATDPNGKVASAHRNIIVDRSGYAIIPVQVILLGDSQQSIENIPIEASTWLYIWRSRFSSGATDANGLAHVRVEALSESPTSYRFQIKPYVVDGVRYEGITPVDIVLPPAASTGSLITLQVKASLGTISGRLSGDIPSSHLQIWAIHLPEGNARTTPLSPDGSFIFKNVSIGEYVVTADPELLAAQGFTAPAENIDLSQSNSGDVELNLLSIAGSSLLGHVMDIDGNRLPFAWVNIEKLKIVEAVMPDTGQYELNEVPTQKVILMANAPGYYSQGRLINLTTGVAAGPDFKLVRRPETRSLAWGNGEIIVPPETHISMSGNHIFLERGWLWGQNQDDDPIIVQSGKDLINITSGKFAIEAIPGQQAWLYLFEGKGTVATEELADGRPIQAGQMIALGIKSQLSVVSFDPVVVRAIRTDIGLPIFSIIQPTIIAQISNRLALFGIDMAKLITFITYILIIVSIILLPVIAVYRWKVNRIIKTDSKRNK